MSDDPEPDPRPRRALLIGGALLAAIVVWNWDWWDHDDPVVISYDRGDADAEAIRDDVRRQVREAVGGARSDAREAIEEAREESQAAIEEAEQADGSRAVRIERQEVGGNRAVRIEREEGGGVTISVSGDGSEG